MLILKVTVHFLSNKMFNSFKVFFIVMGTVFLKDKLIFLESGKPDKFCVYTVYYWKNQSCPT